MILLFYYHVTFRQNFVGLTLSPSAISALQITATVVNCVNCVNCAYKTAFLNCLFIYPLNSATMPEKQLSVEDQVRCLIDHASDPHILGITWAGWEPWK